MKERNSLYASAKLIEEKVEISRNKTPHQPVSRKVYRATFDSPDKTKGDSNSCKAEDEECVLRFESRLYSNYDIKKK